MTFTMGLVSLMAAATPLIRPPPPTGARTVSTFGQIFENLEAYGALSGDDLFVVVGRDDDVSVLGGEFFSFGLALVGAGADDDDFCAEFGSGLALDGRCVVGHDDDAFDLERAGGVGNALGVVAAGVGDDASVSFGLQRGKRFCCRRRGV